MRPRCNAKQLPRHGGDMSGVNRDDRDELARRLAASAPTPEQPASFFDTLAQLAVDSTPARARNGRRLLRFAAIGASTVVLLSGAAYAGALGDNARDGVRQVLRQSGGQAPDLNEDHDPADTAPSDSTESRVG